MKIRCLAGLVVVALFSRVAAAQTPAANASPPNDTSKLSKAEHARITNMKAWVDSAASAAPPFRSSTDTSRRDRGPTRADSLAAGVGPKLIGSGVDSVRYIVGETRVTKHEGAPAPATATALPTLALFGVIAIVVGAVLLRAPSRAGDDA